jgi:peroxiredoxin
MKMKIVIIFAVLLLVSCNSPSNRFTITGLTLNIPDSTKIYLSNESSTFDSSLVINNRFNFKGEIDSLAQFSIHTKDAKEYKSIWIDNSDIIIDASKSYLRNGHVSGSKFQELNTEYINTYNSWDIKLESQNSLIHANRTNYNILQSLKYQYDSLLTARNEAFLKLIRSNPDFYLASYYITFLMFNQPKQITEEMFSALSKDPQNNIWGRSIKIYLEKSRDLVIGDMAVDFTLPDIDNNKVALSSFKDKYVLLEFWASWCGPCRMENPNLLKLYRQYNQKGFQILGVSLDENRSLWASTIKSDTLIWPTVSDLKGNLGDVVLTYKINSIPRNFLINKDGIIIGKNLRVYSLEQKLDSIFKSL